MRKHMRQYYQLKPLVEPNFQQWGEVIARILANRGLSLCSELSAELRDILPLHHFKYIRPAAELIANAVMQQKRICISGDYDVDGATSCVIMVDFLRKIGANVTFIVPNRRVHGYGISSMLIDEMGEVDLIITVDNGINAVEACAYAKQRGVQIVITDHHLPGVKLPDADVIVNPSHPDEVFPDRSIAGVAVAWYVMAALRSELEQRNYFLQKVKPNMAEYLDLVALGTVADCVALSQLNRAFVVQGLRRMNTKPRVGIQALLNVAKKEVGYVNAQDLGFALGPRLNAAGRLTDMRAGIFLLLEQDEQKAFTLAQNLDELNRSRRDIERQALNSIEELDASAKGIVVYDPTWHEGVIGLIASRVKERMQLPVIALTQDDQGFLKGSARSICGVHIRDILATMDQQLPGMILKFGGHAMAAGLSLNPDCLHEFKRMFAHHTALSIENQGLQGDLYYDFELAENSLTLDFAKQLSELTPWGMEMKEPVFKGVFKVASVSRYESGFLKMNLQFNRLSLAAVAFGLEELITEGDVLECYYSIHVNRFRGQESLQLLVRDVMVGECA
jgi:single-stranded-DNA-specific exonuclease